MRVVCYNIRHGVGCDRRLDLERIAGVIEQAVPDLVGLNEVDVRFHRRSQYMDQLGWLADRLGMTGVFGPAIQWMDPLRRHLRQYGNGMLVKGTVLKHWNLPFPGRGSDEPRGMLVADLLLEKRSVRVVVTHMGLTPWMRRRQVRALMDLCREYPDPLIAMGDWNVIPGHPAVIRLSPCLTDVLESWGVSEGTYPCTRPRKRIDYILGSPHFRIRNAGVIATPACPSDHLPVWCEMDLEEKDEVCERHGCADSHT